MKRVNNKTQDSYFDGKFEDLEKKIDDTLNKQLDEFVKRFVNYIDLRFQLIDEAAKKVSGMDERINRIDNNVDWLIGEYKKFSDEHFILTNQYSDLNQKIDNHEDRIKLLEKRKVN